MKMLRGLKGDGVLSANIQTVGLVVALVLVVIAVGLLLSVGQHGAAYAIGSAYNTVASTVSGVAGGFDNPFSAGGSNWLNMAYTQYFP